MTDTHTWENGIQQMGACTWDTTKYEGEQKKNSMANAWRDSFRLGCFFFFPEFLQKETNLDTTAYKCFMALMLYVWLIIQMLCTHTYVSNSFEK